MSTIQSEAKSTQLSSQRVRAGGRSYFFDLWAGPKGGLHLTISETSVQEPGVFKRSRIVVFDNTVRDFYEGLCEAIRSLREEQKKREEAGAAVESKPSARRAKAA